MRTFENDLKMKTKGWTARSRSRSRSRLGGAVSVQ